MQAITITEISQNELECLIEQTLIRVLEQSKKAETSKPTNRALTIKEAANFAGCADTTIRKAYRERKIKGHRQAGRLYFFEEDILTWIKQG
ncbi:MAG: helix-turn-helix domain-containing protein [Cytophagia bacterium]|nr:helix-turn-helix domain-containing protein [Cytophagia bacterium]